MEEMNQSLISARLPFEHVADVMKRLELEWV